MPHPETAADTDGTTRYTAVFSRADRPEHLTVPLPSTAARPDDGIRELWTRTDHPHDGRHLTLDLPAHGVAL